MATRLTYQQIQEIENALASGNKIEVIKIYRKVTGRVAALAMVMGLCLLVYTLAQRKLRQAPTKAKQTIPNQLGKPMATPTMRWGFQCFQSIHLVVLNEIQQVVNLSLEHYHVIQFLSFSFQKYYLLV